MKNFIYLSHDEKLMVLDWRNDIRVRNNMYSSDKILIDNHLKFIDKLKNNNENKYFLIDDLGVIYFKHISGNKAELGLYSNPEKHGVGDILMSKILLFGYDFLYLEVLESNSKAISLYERFKFKILNKKNIEGKQIICMRYRKNENR